MLPSIEQVRRVQGIRKPELVACAVSVQRYNRFIAAVDETAKTLGSMRSTAARYADVTGKVKGPTTKRVISDEARAELYPVIEVLKRQIAALEGAL
jgi:hypothetical protein